MKAINNFENVKETTGKFSKPKAGGYFIEILAVKDVPINEQTGKGDYLKIDYDICHGEFAGYYTKQNEKFGGDWFANFIRSYKETAAGMFKHFINCVEESNAGYKWEWDEQTLVHKYLGVVLAEEEYQKRDGSVCVKLVVRDVKTVDQIAEGDFEVPAIKRIAVTASSPSFDFVDAGSDEELPF